MKRLLIIPLLLALVAPRARGAGEAAPAKQMMAQGHTEVSVAPPSPYTLPTIALSGPEKVRPGHMVVMTAEVDRSKLPDSLLSVKYQWQVLVNGVPTSDFLTWPDGTKIILNSPDIDLGQPDGMITVILDVDCLFGVARTVKEGSTDVQMIENAAMNSPDLAVHKIVVSSPGPVVPTPPPVPPTPTPPAPVLPQGKYGLSGFIYNAFKGDTALTASDKAALAAALAGNYLAGSTSTEAVRDTLLASTNAANKATAASLNLGGRDAGVKKVLGDQLYAMLYGQAPSIVTTADLKTAFAELALGLQAVGR